MQALGEASVASGFLLVAIAIGGGGALLLSLALCLRRRRRKPPPVVSLQLAAIAQQSSAVEILPPQHRPPPPPHEKERPFDVFISFRFGEAHAEALALKAALEACSLKVFLSNVSAGANLQNVIANALRDCALVVVLATHTYGRQTNGLFDTAAEMNFTISQRKEYFLVRMIPPDANWEEATVTMAFPPSIMYKLWLPGTPMPEDIVDEIVGKLGGGGPGKLYTASSRDFV